MAYKNSPTNPVQTLTNNDEAVKVILVDEDGNNSSATITGVAGTEYTEGDTVASGKGTLFLGKNGTTVLPIKVDSGGAIQVDLEVAEVSVTSSALPTGAATEATLAGVALETGGNLDTIAGDTTSIDTNTGTIAGDTTSLDASISGPGAPTIDSYTNAAISAAANTANQSLIAAPGANKQIWVYGVQYTVGTAAGTVSFQDEDDTAITGVMEHAQYSGMAISPSGNYAQPFWKLATNKALEVDTVTCDIKGSIQYAIVSI